MGQSIKSVSDPDIEEDNDVVNDARRDVPPVSIGKLYAIFHMLFINFIFIHTY